jgi:F-type H+-transporting ATPase subunit delta
MIVTAVAKKYGRALVDVALERNSHQAILRNLQIFTESLQENPKLLVALRSPAIPADSKMQLIESLFQLVGERLDPQSRNLLRILIANNRIGLIDQVYAAYQNVLNQRMGIVTAEVTTRFEVNETQKRLLAARLETITGSKAKLTFNKDESILGGMILQVGSTIYDGSLKRQLESIHSRLSGD